MLYIRRNHSLRLEVKTAGHRDQAVYAEAQMGAPVSEALTHPARAAVYELG